jgi:hypothetical protein
MSDSGYVRFTDNMITRDHMYGYQDEYVANISEDQIRNVCISDEQFHYICSSLSSEDKFEPMIKSIEKLIFEYSESNHSEVVNFHCTDDGNTSFDSTFMTCIFKNGNLNSPSYQVPAVVFTPFLRIKHSIWYENGIPYRTELPNYIIEYEEGRYEIYKMYYFNNEYNLDDLQLSCSSSGCKVMPAKMKITRSFRSDVDNKFKTWSYINGIKNVS